MAFSAGTLKLAPEPIVVLSRRVPLGNIHWFTLYYCERASITYLRLCNTKESITTHYIHGQCVTRINRQCSINSWVVKRGFYSIYSLANSYIISYHKWNLLSTAISLIVDGLLWQTYWFSQDNCNNNKSSFRVVAKMYWRYIYQAILQYISAYYEKGFIVEKCPIVVCDYSELPRTTWVHCSFSRRFSPSARNCTGLQRRISCAQWAPPLAKATQPFPSLISEQWVQKLWINSSILVRLTVQERLNQTAGSHPTEITCNAR